jgi:hypothetical protein
VFARPVAAPIAKLFPRAVPLQGAAWLSTLGLLFIVLALSVFQVSPELNRWLLGAYSLLTYVLLMRRLRMNPGVGTHLVYDVHVVYIDVGA